uniref:TSA: Wollemia nobilis Ref_Wollemi_Transcript_28336_779 transcribed RNA sequence n=1 Tax=Wollemia nobilis TaxID=56998 RepID=A0A0C9QLH7_9CONI
MKIVDVSVLILSVALPIGIGFLGSLVGNGGNSEWYKQLKKPPWTPPNWAFPVVWTILYALMGIAAWRVWIHAGFERQSIALGIYLFQLLLNFLWTPLFFGLHSLSAALADIVLLWFAIAATIYLFWHIDAMASYLLVPYILWVTLASTLNLYIWIHYDAKNTLHGIRSPTEQHPKSS